MSMEEKAYWDKLCAEHEDMEFGRRCMESDHLDREVLRTSGQS